MNQTTILHCVYECNCICFKTQKNIKLRYCLVKLFIYNADTACSYELRKCRYIEMYMMEKTILLNGLNILSGYMAYFKAILFC